MNSKKKLITHNGSFHADDIFATAVLSIFHRGKIKIIRTRDPEIIRKGDYVYDVGGDYNPVRNLFDHHQTGGAGVRDNGIPYAAFGLVWKTYGEKICHSKEIADRIDLKIVQSIDATDNGIDITTLKYPGVKPYGIDQAFLSECPTWEEKDSDIDKIFKKQVKKAEALLKREIEVVRSEVLGQKNILESYQKFSDKKIIFLNKPYFRSLIQDVLSKLPEPIYVIYPSRHSSSWKIEAIHLNPETFQARKLFPESWRVFLKNINGLKEETGIADISFCHQSGFLAIVGSKESALKLAKLALEK